MNAVNLTYQVLISGSDPSFEDKKLAEAKASQGWAGIPFNFCLNTGMFLISITIFTFLNKNANSDRSKNSTRIRKGWLHFIYANREPRTTARRKMQPCVESHVHDNRYPGVLLTPAILAILNAECEDTKDDQSMDSEAIKIEDNEGIDFDRQERKAEYIHKYMEEVKIRLRQSGNWFFDLFFIRDIDILQTKGTDAMQYLLFERYIIFFLFSLSILCLFVVLPVNLQGDAVEGENYFLTTTIWNIEADSGLMWVHVLLGVILYPVSAYLMCHFSAKIRVDEENICKRTLFIRQIPKWMRSKQVFINFLQKKIPNIRISAVQLVYDVRSLSSTLLQYNNVVNAKYYCEDYLIELGDRFEGRPYIFGKFGGLFCCCYCCPKVDGLEYYNRIQMEFEKRIEEEYEQCIANPKGTVFVTFEAEEMATKVKSFIESNRQNCAKFCADFGACISKRGERSSNYENVHAWIVDFAPFPEDIIWSTVALDLKVIWFRRISVYVFLLIIFFFFSTPAILLQFAEGHLKESKTILRKLENFSPMLAMYIEPLMLVIVGNLLPTFVILASNMLPHTTISSKNYSAMVKTYIFLLLMIVILPSLGYTSTIGLVNKIIGENGTLPLTSLTSGTGSLFTNYVIQSALLSNALELLRISEVFVYFIFILLSSTSAEYERTRTNVIYEFQFGTHYSVIMLIVFIVVAYSLTCPLIVPCGLLYMVIKYAVDRYNIYFVYNTSRIDIRIHSTSIIFFHISLMAMQLRLISCLTLIESISQRTGVLSLAFIIEILLFCIQFYNSYFHGLFAFKKREKKYFQEWCACSYVPNELREVITRGMVPLDVTSVTHQTTAIKVIEIKKTPNK